MPNTDERPITSSFHLISAGTSCEELVESSAQPAALAPNDHAATAYVWVVRGEPTCSIEFMQAGTIKGPIRDTLVWIVHASMRIADGELRAAEVEHTWPRR